MKAFVTGGTGFVGSHLVEALLDAGHEVTCLVRNPAKAQHLFPDRSPRLVTGDLENPTALREATNGCEVVFHSAALTKAPNRAAFFRINEAATKQLLKAVAASGAPVRRFVHVSSLAAAGPSKRGHPLGGDEPGNPVTHYGASKLAAELAVRASSLPWTIVRPPTVYGPRDVELLKMFRLARQGLLPLFGDGSQELSLIHVADLADALVAVAIADASQHKVYCACHPEVITARDLAVAIHDAVRRSPGAKPLVLPIPGLAARTALWITGTAARLVGKSTLLSADKANEFLAEAWTCAPGTLESDTGWVARLGHGDGIAETATWYREHGWL